MTRDSILSAKQLSHNQISIIGSRFMLKRMVKMKQFTVVKDCMTSAVGLIPTSKKIAEMVELVSAV